MTMDRAASAYGHALAVVGVPEVAAEIAADAVRLGGRSLTAVLGHARAGALAAAADLPSRPEAPAPSLEDEGESLAARAEQLAAGRPPLERAVVDLAGRHGLDRGGLGRALGTSPSEAAAELSRVSAAWEDELDPALLVLLGPGECQELAERLADGSPADAVSHVRSCEVCSDRRRAMVSVQSLLNQIPLPAPPAEVAAVAAASRRRRPVPPPPLSPPVHRARRLLVALGALGAAAALVGGGTAAFFAVRDHDRAQGARVRDLTRVRTSVLTLAPDVLGPSTNATILANTSGQTLMWRAVASVPWLVVSPSSGTLGPGARTVLQIAFDDAAPQGPLHGAVTVTSNDGSVAGASLAGILDRPPQLDAQLGGCTVTAAAEDSDGVAGVELRWRDGSGNHQVAMARTASVYAAALPAGPGVTAWWVTAVDTVGNTATLAERPLPAGGCTPV